MTPHERRTLALMTAAEREAFHAIGGRMPVGVLPVAVAWHVHDRRRHLWELKPVQRRRPMRCQTLAAAAPFRPGQAIVVRADAPGKHAGRRGIVTRSPRQPRWLCVRLDGTRKERHLPTAWLIPAPRTATAA